MPEFNTDTSPLFEPITVIIDEKKYVIEKITRELLDQVHALAAKSTEDDANKESASSLVERQFCVFTGETPEVVREMDWRKVGSANRFIFDCITDSIRGEGAKKPEVVEKSPQA